MNKKNTKVAIAHLENLLKTEEEWLDKNQYTQTESYPEVRKRVFVINESLQALYLKSKLVFCKDCVHYTHPELGWCAINSRMDDSGESWLMYMDNDFCSNGEVRDEGNQ